MAKTNGNDLPFLVAGGGIGRDRRDRGERIDRVVVEVLVERRDDRVEIGAAEQQGVAVGGGTGDGLDPVRPPAPV